MQDQTESVECTQVDNVVDVEYEYSIKVMNSNRKSDFKNLRICKWNSFKTLHDLREFLGNKVPSIGGEKPDFNVVDIGYLEPGHGMKGRKQWLNTDDDVEVMYEKHAGNYIQLWSYSHSNNKGRQNQGIKAGGSNFQDHKECLSKVDEIYNQLRQKHGSTYTLEQLRMWAQMIRLGKHESIDHPLDKPFWCGRKRQQSALTQPPAKRVGIFTISSVSPSKRISVRSELLIN